jgi:hypothetical protein
MKIIAVMVILACITLSFTSCTSDYKAEKDTEMPYMVVNMSDQKVLQINDAMMCPEYSIVYESNLYVFKYDWEMNNTILLYKVDLHNYHWTYICGIILIVVIAIILCELPLRKKKVRPF